MSDFGQILGAGSILLSVCGAIYAAVNHKRIKAKCCGRNIEMEIHIDEASKRNIQVHPEEVKIPVKRGTESMY